MPSRIRRARPLRATALLAALSALFAALAAVALSPHAHAQRLRAQVFVTQAAIPRGLTEKGLIGFARGHKARFLEESSEPEIANRRWMANLVTAFNTAPGDLEYHALFYDLTNGARDFVDDMAIYLNGRDQETYVQRLNLARPRFRPNRRYEIAITVRHTECGTTRFETHGEEIRHTGQVDFSEEQAAGRD